MFRSEHPPLENAVFIGRACSPSALGREKRTANGRESWSRSPQVECAKRIEVDPKLGQVAVLRRADTPDRRRPRSSQSLPASRVYTVRGVNEKTPPEPGIGPFGCLHPGLFSSFGLFVLFVSLQIFDFPPQLIFSVVLIASFENLQNSRI